MTDANKKTLLFAVVVLGLFIAVFAMGRGTTTPALQSGPGPSIMSGPPPQMEGNFKRLDRIIERSDSVLHK